jgi:hypothetical protein
MLIRAGISYNYTISDILSQLSSALSIISHLSHSLRMGIDLFRVKVNLPSLAERRMKRPEGLEMSTPDDGPVLIVEAEEERELLIHLFP